MFIQWVDLLFNILLSFSCFYSIVVSSACAWPVLNRGATRGIVEIRFSCDRHICGHCDARESVGSVKLRREMCQN